MTLATLVEEQPEHHGGAPLAVDVACCASIFTHVLFCEVGFFHSKGCTVSPNRSLRAADSIGRSSTIWEAEIDGSLVQAEDILAEQTRPSALSTCRADEVLP